MKDTIDFRDYQDADLGGVVALLARCLSADPITSETFQRKVLLDANFSRRGAQVAERDGRIVGFALGIVRTHQLEDAAPDFDQSWITLIAVADELRRQRIGAEMVSRLEQYFKESNCKSAWVSPYAPNYFAPGVDVNAYPEALEFFTAQGYAMVYRPLAMDANLVHLATPQWVIQKEENLTGHVLVEPFRVELILPLLDFLKAEFPGDWQRWAREAMAKITLGQFRPNNLWIAHRNGRVVGYCQHDDSGRFGPFGVASSERGRGIGAVILFRCLHAMRAKGVHNAWFMWTDDKTAGLYAEAGFVESRRFAVMKKGI